MSDALVDDRAAGRAAAMRDQIRAAGGPAAAADVVEELLSGTAAGRCAPLPYAIGRRRMLRVRRL